MSVRSNVRKVALLALAAGMMLPAGAAAQERLYVDVNFGVAIPATSDLTSSISPTVYGEPANFTVDYKWPTAPVFDVGGGFMLTPQLGVGVSYSRSQHSDVPSLSMRLPHPFIPNTYADASAAGDTELKRTENALHIQAMFVAYESDTQRFRVFGGPTYMQVKSQTVGDFDYTQVFGFNPASNSVTIDTYEIHSCDCSGWGFNLGADYSYFFTPTIGVGGVLRYTRVKVEPVDFAYDLNGPLDLTAGGTAIGGGIRFRF